MDNVNELYNSLVAQLKEMATSSYNAFYKAYEEINDKTEESRLSFIKIINNSDFLLSSLDYYNHLFKDLDRGEDILYISQIITLLIKSSHNLFVISRSKDDKSEMDKYLKKKEEYKDLLYFYYLMGEDNKKLEPILSAFVKDSGITENNILNGYTKYQTLINERG